MYNVFNYSAHCPHNSLRTLTRAFLHTHDPFPCTSRLHPFLRILISPSSSHIRVFSFRFNPYKGPLSLITIATTRRIYIYILSLLGVWTRQGNPFLSLYNTYNILGSKKLVPRIYDPLGLYIPYWDSSRKRAALARII